MVYIFNAIPFLLSFLIAGIIIAWVGFTLHRPEISIYLLLAILTASASSTYGQLETSNTIYSRGTGQLYFSFINIFLWGLGIVVLTGRLFRRRMRIYTPLTKYYLVFIALIIANAIVAMVSDEKYLSAIDAFSYNGLLNIVNMAVLFYICIATFDTSAKIHQLVRFMLIAIGLRGLFGMARYFFFGGDPSNIYDNFEHTGAKLTFFDVGDAFLALTGMYCSAWLLSFKADSLSRVLKFSLAALLLLETVIVFLSFRRSSLISMALMAILFISLLPAKKRFIPMLVAAGSILGGGMILTALRLDKLSGASNRGFLFDLMGGDKGAGSSSRVLEYTETWRSLDDNWLFGQGMWGVLRSNLTELSYHAGDFRFVHSGFGHVLLKSGVLGLLSFIGLFLSFAVFYSKNRNQLTGDARLLADAGAAGVLFWLPSLLIGTPIVEFRSMLLLGFALALPFVAKHATAISAKNVAA